MEEKAPYIINGKNTRRKKYLSRDDFIAIFNDSDSYTEIAYRTGLSVGNIMNRAWKLRKQGIVLNSLRPVQKLGVVGWLKKYHPPVYDDLRLNYPEIYKGS